LLGLEIHLKGIFSFFRIPYNSLLMDTYAFPPKTTAIGFVSAALGWGEEEYLSKLPQFLYGVIIEDPGETVSEIAAIFKTKEAPIYPIIKNMNYKPSYRVFIASQNESLMEKAEAALRDPVFVLSLGDSENLWYPKAKDFVILREIEERDAASVKCILPTELFQEYYKDYSRISDTFLPPKEVRIPVAFTGSGRRRRFIPKSVYYYSGIEVNLNKPLRVFDFDGDGVYLF
jgi:CRISPR-associated protein Cas5h